MYQYHTLKNGIRIVFNANLSQVTYSGVYINVGSRDEVGEEEGMAHFIEHSIFKGTAHRRAYHILNRIDGVGGELNAFTTKEETCLYASSLSIHLERCLELFSDILFHSVFPFPEIVKERDVVIEEINSYKDAPSELIYDEFEELFFAGHPLSHNILGTKRNVSHFTPDSIRQFLHQHYSPDRMVISIVGNADFKKVVRLCQKYFEDYPAFSVVNRRSAPSPCLPFQRIINRHTHQVHAMIGCAAPSLFDERKVPFTLLNNILGGPAMNSRLNVAIRERYGFCYTIETQYSPFTDAGLFYVYAGVDADAQQRATELILDELRRCAASPMSDRLLRAAQRQMIGQMAINNDTAINEMQSIGKAYLNFDHVDSLDDMNRDILRVTPADILSVASDFFDVRNLCYLYYK